MAEISLRKALAVRRYDRAAAGLRIHQEDLNQIFVQYPKDKYKKRNFSNVTAVVADQAGVAAGLDVVRRLTLSTPSSETAIAHETVKH